MITKGFFWLHPSLTQNGRKNPRLRFLLARLLGASLLLFLLLPPNAHAAAEDHEQLSSLARAIEEGRYATAIETSERLADQGIVHPDLSYNRGLAYLHRARSPAAEAGDYGQAVAGFREALLLRAEDPEAARGLEEARVAIARRSSKKQEDLAETIGLDHRLLLSLHLGIVAIIAALGSLLLSTALLLFMAPRLRGSLVPKVMTGIGALLLLPTASLYFLADHERRAFDRAVVVSKRATLLGPEGKPVRGVAPLIEGTEVLTEKSRGGLVHLSMDPGNRWLRRSQLRVLVSTPSRGWN